MDGLAVGEVAARLGVAPSTVRMWGRRYGLVASGRSPGGHRRYTVEDLALLERMHEAVISGESPAQAAAAALGRDTPAPAVRPGGPGGSVLAVPGGDATTRGVARAASRLDEIGVEDAVVQTLRDRGVLTAWDAVLRPVLVAAGDHWFRTGNGIEVEHLLTQAVSTAFVRYATTLPEPPRERPVLLAGAPHEEHVLPLLAIRTALVERSVPARLLGPRTPLPALRAAARRTRAAGVFVWMSRTEPVDPAELQDLAAAHRRLKVLVGGPGWDAVPTSLVTRCTSLEDAVARLETTWAEADPPPRPTAGSRG